MRAFFGRDDVRGLQAGRVQGELMHHAATDESNTNCWREVVETLTIKEAKPRTKVC